MMRRAAFCLIMFASAFGAWPCTAIATDPSVLIIDSSGSMAARLGNETRLDAARMILLNEVAGWKTDASLALVAYGHRRAGDCGDIETLSALGPVRLEPLRNELAKLRARGKTPLSGSLRHAARLLPKEGGNILLLSDGLETCNEDPCAVARDLHAANAKVIVHVVGFGLKDAEDKALACIAEAGGGSMLSADGASELQKALTDFSASTGVAETVKIPEKPVELTEDKTDAERSPTVAQEPTAVPVSFIAVAEGKDMLIGVPLSWTVRAKGSEKPLYEGGGEGIALVLKPGPYTVELKGANAASIIEVTVDRSGGPAIKVGIDLGRLDLSLIAAKGMSLDDVDLGSELAWTVTPLDGQAALANPTSARQTLALAPGRYAVAVTIKDRAAQAEVLIKSGGREALVLNLRLGRLRLEAVLDGKSEPIDGGTELSWRISGPTEDRPPINFDAVARPVVVLPAGRYGVTLSIGGADIATEAVVAEGEDQTERVEIGAGTVTLEGSLGPGSEVFSDWRDAQWTVRPVRVIGGATVGPALENHAEARPVLTLMPGEWEATLVSGTATANVRFTAQPGETQTVRIDQAAGRLSMAAKAATGEPPSNILLSVFGPAKDGAFPERPLFEVGVPREYAQIVTAGRYRVVALDSTGRTGAAEIDLAAGQSAQMGIELK
jgi:Ca-activated chloride channel family protein